MMCIRPPLMYWPRREMKAGNNMQKRVQRTQLQILRRIQNNKNIQSTANVPNDGPTNLWKKTKKTKIVEPKKMELFTVLLKILNCGCARQ